MRRLARKGDRPLCPLPRSRSKSGFFGRGQSSLSPFLAAAFLSCAASVWTSWTLCAPGSGSGRRGSGQARVHAVLHQLSRSIGERHGTGTRPHSFSSGAARSPGRSDRSGPEEACESQGRSDRTRKWSISRISSKTRSRQRRRIAIPNIRRTCSPAIWKPDERTSMARVSAARVTHPRATSQVSGASTIRSICSSDFCFRGAASRSRLR